MRLTKIEWLLGRGINFIELAIALLLPWKLRCKYSEFLMILHGSPPDKDVPKVLKEKERNFEIFLHLGFAYAQEKKFNLAIENLNKALEIDPDNEKIQAVYQLLAVCHKSIGETDKYIKAMANFLKVKKNQK